MADEGAVLLGSQPPEAFFGRVGELQRLRRDARSLLRGRGRTRVVCAGAGAGKTELFRQWHGRLFQEGEILPVYWAVPAARDAVAIAAECVEQFALQALAFARRDPSLLRRSPSRESVASALHSAYGGAGTLLAEELTRCEGGAPNLDPLAFTLIPHSFSLAAGIRVLWLLDDAGNLLRGRDAVPLPAAAAASATAPLLIALEEESALGSLLGQGAAAIATLERLAPLSADAVRQMTRHLARISGLQLGEAAVAALEREAAGSPFYLAALVRALDEQGGAGPEDVARAAAAAVCDGELARYWLERLAAHLPARGLRATALEILVYCLREEGDVAETTRLAARMLKPEGEIEAALAALRDAGMLRLDCARIVVDGDPVFRDVVVALYRREFERVSPAVIAASCAAAKVREAAGARRRRAGERFRESFGALLLGWDGQQAPRDLFDAPAFARRQAALVAGEPIAGAETPTVTLPKIVSVASGRVGAAGSPASADLDAIAWGFRGGSAAGDADVTWVARRIAGGAGSAAQLGGFDRQIAALQGAGDLPAGLLVRWVLLDAPLDPDGEREAARLRLMTSTHVQLAALAAVLGLPAPARPEPSEAEAAPGLELEMIIPKAADAELVAARALEQLAENLGMSPEDAGRVKTALVEACINAFEHSGDRDGRVRLWFGVAGGRLVIRVENRGRALAALPAPAAPGDQPRRRGWGLTLIRQLIDDVRIEPREDGVSLVMEKNLGVRSHG